MKQVKVPTWKEFQVNLQKLLELHAGFQQRTRNIPISPLLFRGHTNHSWQLKTTLERFKKECSSVKQYYKTILAAKPQIETFTGLRWEIPTCKEYEALIQNDKWFPSCVAPFPGYEYMVYLRHHGFPSPLLDWTCSPYIAAYFAFSPVGGSAEDVSIYAFLEQLVVKFGMTSRLFMVLVHTYGATKGTTYSNASTRSA